jgi:hypothetical protein
MAAAPMVAVLRTGDGGRGERGISPGLTRPAATGKVALELMRFAPCGQKSAVREGFQGRHQMKGMSRFVRREYSA